MIIENVINKSDIDELVSWAASQEDKLNQNGVDTGRFFGLILNLEEPPIQNLKETVQSALGKTFGKLVSVSGDYLSINKPNSFIPSYKLTQIDGKDVIRGLLILQAPEGGGEIQYEGDPDVSIVVGSVWAQNICTKEHGTTPITGTKDRYMIAFNFQVA